VLRLFSTDSPFPANQHPAIPLVLLVLLDFLICRSKLPPEVPFGRELFEEVCGLLHRPVWTSYAPGSPLPSNGLGCLLTVRYAFTRPRKSPTAFACLSLPQVNTGLLLAFPPIILWTEPRH
jgi:hypothetical protein